MSGVGGREGGKEGWREGGKEAGQMREMTIQTTSSLSDSVQHQLDARAASIAL